MTQDISTVGLTIATTKDMQSGNQQQEAEAMHLGNQSQTSSECE